MGEDGAYMTPEGAQPRPVGAIVRSRYRILGVVGRGGLGVVYRVSDILYSSHNVFALKELSDQAAGARKQFELESRWLQELDHNNIPRVRESFEWDGRSYLVMDFVEGENLEQYLRRIGRPLPEEQALRWMLPICDALQYLHTRTPPLLHRDVKPANIIVTPGGHPVLVDFGIAKAHLPGMNQTVTFVRKAGTEGYAPPEQYAANGMTGPWSDVYGLGATLYQLLTNHVPQTAVERVTGVAPMPHPRALNPAITPLTDAAIMRAMELKPSNRYHSVTEFAAQMMEALQLSRFTGSGPHVAIYPSEASQPSPAPQTSRPPQGVSGPSSPSGPRASVAQAAPQLPPLGSPIPSNLPPSTPGSALPPAPSPPPTPALRSGALAAPSAPRMAPTVARLPTSRPSISGNLPDGQAPAKKSTRRGPRLGVLIGLLVALMVVVGGLSVVAYQYFAPPDRSTPQATVTGYFNALEQQNYTRAWDYSSASRNDPGSQAAFNDAVSSDDARYGKVLSFSITQSQSDNAGHTNVTVSVTRASAPTSPLIYAVSVTQYGGALWLIDSASSQ